MLQDYGTAKHTLPQKEELSIRLRINVSPTANKLARDLWDGRLRLPKILSCWRKEIVVGGLKKSGTTCMSIFQTWFECIVEVEACWQSLESSLLRLQKEATVVPYW